MLVCLAGAGHRLAQKNPERPGHVEIRPDRSLVTPDAALLIEGQQTAQQVHVAVGVFHALGKVGDDVVLAVAVLVKPAIGVIEQQTFPVGVA